MSTSMAAAFARAFAEGAADADTDARMAAIGDDITAELRERLQQEGLIPCSSPPGEPSPSPRGGAKSGPPSSSATGTAA